MPAPKNPLEKWLGLQWDKPERAYNPYLRDFFAEVLGYPKDHVLTEDRQGGGYADLKLLTAQKRAWIVGDLKKDDERLTIANGLQTLWLEKKRYVDGLTRFVVFITPHFIWVGLSTGEAAPGFQTALDLRLFTLEELQAKLAFIAYAQANHAQLWQEFTTGELPFSYLDLRDADTTRQLRSDLTDSFAELSLAATRAIGVFERDYRAYTQTKKEIDKQLGGNSSAKRRALVRLDIGNRFVRHLFEESLPQFEEQYGREIDDKSKVNERLKEAFVSDSVAALTARVLFLRLIEDLGLTKKRRLSNGGPRNWNQFVETLTGDAKALVRVASEDAARLYHEPFEQTVFDWINHANGELDESLQRLILRLNAYDFAGLSEELLGDIYQQFLPLTKRKRLGEFYTPPSIVDWILEQTVNGEGEILDPSCGSGSFLVRYAHRKLEDAKIRKLEPDLVRQELQAELWGFDLNPFASFITYFQMLWAMLRFHPAGIAPSIHVYNLNSLLRDEEVGQAVGTDLLPPGSLERDGKKWKYIVGNPPYIRAERIKYGDEVKTLWSSVWGQNSDTGLVFLYRAINEWLEDGGVLGMVVSGGYASSEAAAKVWKLLHPGGKASLRKIVWLEFIQENGKSKQIWDAARVPLILIVEKTPPKDDDVIEIFTPQTWNDHGPQTMQPQRVKYTDFWDKRVNPKVSDTDTAQGTAYKWGDYLLPLLETDDTALIKKLSPNGNSILELRTFLEARGEKNQKSPFTYGIQRGGIEIAPNSGGKKPIQVLAGRSIAVGWSGDSQGWIDLDAVAKRPNGKLSLWSEDAPSVFIASSEIGLSIGATIVISEPKNPLAAVNSVVVARPKPGGPLPEVITCLLNSSLICFYLHTKLRSGVIQGCYAHFYPRTLEALPFPATLSKKLETRLVDGYKQLEALAKVAKNNPNQWFLDAALEAIGSSGRKITDASFGLSFADWGEDVIASELEHDGVFVRAGLFGVGFASESIAIFVYKLLTLPSDEDAIITKKSIQALRLPDNLDAIMQEYGVRLEAFKNVERDFMAVLAEIDEAVFEAFELTAAERAYIQQRLSSFPLNRLKPRYPWDTVSKRGIKAYTEDRFA